MGLDFDALEYCKSVKQKQTHPPYACPVRACDRSYKTVVGLQYHLMKYDHDNMQPLTPVLTPNRKKARTRGAHHSTPKDGVDGGVGSVCGDDGKNGSSSGASISTRHVNPEALVTYNEEKETVQFNIDGKSVRLGIDEPLPLINDDEFAALVERGCILNADAPPLEENAPWMRVQVPEPKVRIRENYNVPDAPPRPLAYYRFIEKSVEELDGEIEYDVDEEDSAWLEHMNKQRKEAGHAPVSIDTMELLMDRLEKESYFQAAANGTPTGVEVDDDAVCCICLDGECQNTNVILFCDMCNLAVHQDCYGVPYIPEGQWLCRRCLQSPSKPVNCVLCPNAGGAFKQTDGGQWAHVVCALWIPEVRFANTVFLEPIDSIETIPAARWRLTCYVCKEKGLGACIQCHRNSCYAAFHVTCAQQAGLYMTMDTVKDGHNDSSMHVQKFAYCHAHTPAEAKINTNQYDFEDTRHKMREARKALAKKRSTAPVVLIPTIPPERVQEISSMVHMQKKKEFMDRIMAYWTLKRHYRNGVPLLRRLQSQGNHHGVIPQRNGIEGSPDTSELYRQLKYWQCLRQDLERARLLCELVRKREKLKAAYVKICEQVVMLELNPLESALTKLLDALEARDTSEIFREPVDTEEVPDYLDIVKQPMDLGTMRSKLKEGKYNTLEQLESDFDLMIQNCLAYNNKDTVFYRAGIRMRDQAAPLFVQLRKELERDGLLEHTRDNHVDHVEQEVETELKQLLTAPPSEDVVQKLLILADKSQVLKNPSYRTKKIKQIRLEITRMRKALKKGRFAARYSNTSANQSQSDEDDVPIKKLHASFSTPKRPRKPLPAMDVDDEEDEEEDEEEDDEDDSMGEDCGSKDTAQTVQTPPCSPVKSLNNSSSPVGVNRRTAILITRKAQAALKRPTEPASSMTTPVKEEHHNSLMPAAALSTAAGTAPTATSVATASSALNSGLLVAATPASPNFTLTHNNNNNATNIVGTVAAATLTTSALTMNNKLGLTPLSASLVNSAAVGISTKSPKRNARYKRLPDMRNSASMSPKKSPLAATGPSMLSAAEPLIFERIPDSFRVYRANNERDASDSDDVSRTSEYSTTPCSSCSDLTISGSGSEFDSMENEDHSNVGERDTNEADSDEDDSDDSCDEEAASGLPKHSGNGTRNTATKAAHSITNNGDGNGMTISGGDSDTSDDEVLKQKRITRSTPTPTTASSIDKRAGRKGTRSKQNKKNNIKRNTSNASTPTPVADTPPLAAALANAIPNTAITTTRATNKHMKHRPATPPNSVNNKRSKKSAVDAAAKAANIMNNNSRMKANNAHLDGSNILSATAAAAAAEDSNPRDIANSLHKPPLEPLQLVWAKCRGYPWYPALILDPKTPKGFVYNGVPLPAPPPDVLALRKNCIDDVVFLVLFFDAKRTWQWLPANKLEILGIDKQLDQQKLVESRKPAERKAVKRAYQDALHYQSQVSDLEGQGPDPIM